MSCTSAYYRLAEKRAIVIQKLLGKVPCISQGSVATPSKWGGSINDESDDVEELRQLVNI